MYMLSAGLVDWTNVTTTSQHMWTNLKKTLLQNVSNKGGSDISSALVTMVEHPGMCFSSWFNIFFPNAVNQPIGVVSQLHNPLLSLWSHRAAPQQPALMSLVFGD